MDLQLVYDPTTQTFDLALDGPSIALDSSLQTSVILSLFVDRRALPDDVLPDDDGTGRSSGDRRGWWGDWYSPAALQAAALQGGTLPVPVDRLGSRLWLLSREKQVQSVLDRAKDYCVEALAWMTDPQYAVASSVAVTTEIVRDGVLGIGIEITKPDGATENHQFDYVWANV